MKKAKLCIHKLALGKETISVLQQRLTTGGGGPGPSNQTLCTCGPNNCLSATVGTCPSYCDSCWQTCNHTTCPQWCP
ncbi:hypothetical protein [Taibaiella koreensis]|uniref:hypothetical protein n=1 Tax=Taibaiella koreensis TaxID=1268548 RepID=UPI000E59D384|nr:hypothetical protein [Taibaiella koreensis]